MRVRFRNPDMSQCPPKLEPYARDPNLTPGCEYEVQAIVVFDGVASMLVLDDLGYPGWKPVWLLETTEGTLPRDWMCNAFSDWPEVLIGPEFIAGSQEQYSAMVELEAPQVERLRRRIAACSKSENDS